MSDQPLEEVPQRPLPKISIAWMLGMITVCAGLFTLLKSALAGSPWAQGATLLIAIVLGTLMSFAVLFLLGMVIDAALTSIRPNGLTRGQRNPNHSKKSSILLILVAFGLVSSGDASAQAVWQGKVPSNVPGLGYTVTASLYRHPGAGGYRPVRLKFSPTGRVFMRDHLVTLTVSSHQSLKTRVAASTTTSIQIRESDTAFTQELLIPLLGNSDSLNVTVSEDGKPIGKRPLRMSFNRQLDHRHANQSVTMGIVDPMKFNPSKRFPDLRAVSTIFGQTSINTSPLPEDADVAKLPNKDARQFAEQVQVSWIQYRIFDPNFMPVNWLALSDLDVMLVDVNSLSKLRGENSRAVQAILAWVSTGGRLWVYGDRAATILENDELVSSQLAHKVSVKNAPYPKRVRNRLRLSQQNDTSILVDEYWRGGAVKQSENMSGQGFKDRSSVYEKLAKASHPIVKTKPPNKVAEQLRHAEYGLGEILTIDQDDPFPGSLQLWSTIRNQSQDMRRDNLWIDRNGLDLQAGNTNYWRWLIDSVGGPPVLSFLTLNSAFVLLVGPIAYFLLRRAGRLYLLYFCGPALAVLVTTGLFAFAIFSDGIDTRLRTHQWTWIDLPARVSVGQDRVTYYSSFGADELAFPNDAMVTPVLPLGIVDYGRSVGENATPTGQVVWSGDRQIWKGDFMPTRSQVQYQITRPIQPAEPVIHFEPTDETSSAFQCHNEMPRRIGPLVFCAQNGELFRVESVEPGESVEMKAAKQTDLQNIMDRRVLPPTGFVPNVQSSWASYYNQRSPTDTIPLLERRLNSWRAKLPPGHFAGIAELDPLRFATDAPEVSDSHHIVMGRAK